MFEFIFAAYAKFMTLIATGVKPGTEMDIITWTKYVYVYDMYRDAAPTVFALVVAVIVVVSVIAAIIIKHEANEA